ncbi:MAG TPA: site-2 protease family protein [Candidatus Vogelbacteria bacterium]|nr:site-2 protease family protein [Candidatus Vogelbacteria bacterium]
MDLSLIFLLLILLLSVIWHELAHGYMALYLGDPTAKLQGRLTLNPLVHIDPLGSIIVPFLLIMLPGDLIFGWAKPVPFNPYLLRGGRFGPALVALAGPLANLSLVAFFTFLLYLDILPLAVISLVVYAVAINLILAMFNLIPLPPLDGSKILAALIPWRYQYVIEWLERNWFLVFIFLFLFIFNYFFVLVGLILNFILPSALGGLIF